VDSTITLDEEHIVKAQAEFAIDSNSTAELPTNTQAEDENEEASATTEEPQNDTIGLTCLFCLSPVIKTYLTNIDNVPSGIE